MAESKITIRYLLSEDGQREALRQALPAESMQEIPLVPGDPEWGLAVDLAILRPDGGGKVEVGFNQPTAGGATYGVPMISEAEGGEKADGPLIATSDKKKWDAPQTVDALLSWEAARRAQVDQVRADRGAAQDARWETERKTKEEKQRQGAAEWLARKTFPGFEILPEVVALREAIEAGEEVGSLDGASGLAPKARDAVDALKGKLAIDAYLSDLDEGDRGAAVRAMERADKYSSPLAVAKKVVAARQEAVEVKAWGMEHGSPRLQACIQEGIECRAIYRDERLALERPGWAWADEMRGEGDEPRNPPAEAFDTLREARKLDPEASMSWWVVSWDEDLDGEEDEDRDCRWVGYVAEAFFLGREIVFGLPDDLRK